MSSMGRAGRAKRRPGSATGSAQSIGAAMGQLVEGLGIARTLKQYDVLTRWASIVGEQIARVTTAQRIEHGILYVHVATAPWRAELTMKRVEIIQKINTTLGDSIVTDIRFR